MSTSKKSILGRILTGLSILIVASIALSGNVAAETHRASNLFINENYRPGDGLPLGKIQASQRGVFIVHAGQNEGYRAKAGLPVYKGDILVSNRKGRALCRMNDGSLFSLAPVSKLTILRSSHNTAAKVSVTILSLDTGLARFQLKNLADYNDRQFKIRTPIAEINAKEGDFIVRSHQEHTKVTALTDSLLEVTGLDSPETVRDLAAFTRAVVEKGVFAAKLESLPPEDVASLISEVGLTPDDPLFDAAREKYGYPDEPDQEAENREESESSKEESSN